MLNCTSFPQFRNSLGFLSHHILNHIYSRRFSQEESWDSCMVEGGDACRSGKCSEMSRIWIPHNWLDWLNKMSSGLLRQDLWDPGEGNGNPIQYSCWKIPRTKKPGVLQSMLLQRVGHNLVTKPPMVASCISWKGSQETSVLNFSLPFQICMKLIFVAVSWRQLEVEIVGK